MAEKKEKSSSAKATEDKQIFKVRHSLSHLLATAVLEKYPETKLGIGPVIENGFYYDFDFKKPISESDLPSLEGKIRELIKEKISFKKKLITPVQGRKLFKKAPYKLQLANELIKAKKPLSIYISGKFTDLCSGPHVKNTSEINPDAFKLMSLAGAYWKGSEKNPMLTRIYGVAFGTKKELEEYLKNQTEAEKRDHRKLGKDLDLFHIDDLVGLGLPLWHPKGALLWRIIEEFWYKKHLENGYELVRTPHIGNKILWQTSGHWGFYNKSMYPPLEAGQTLEEKQQNKKAVNSEEYILKPMNCPFHIEIYKSQPRSYRELPFRWAECGTVYRFEKRGELSGLIRVRGFTQDDAHIICGKDQVENELKKVIDFILFIYKSFGFNSKDVNVYLSLRDPKDKKKYAGNDTGWNFTQNVLRKVAREKKLDFKEELGEAAFYGPKLDFKIKDALSREWQCSTLQFDFNLPERFDMNFTNAQGEKERPYMLHRALFGSFERFIGLLIEHYAGAFPVWLSPVQVKIISVSEAHIPACQKLATEFKETGIRVEIDGANKTVSNKIRKSMNEKVPYMLVIGDKEMNASVLNVRDRGVQETREISRDSFIKEIMEKVKNHS